MCIVLYQKVIQCSQFCSSQFNWGRGYVWPGYMCIVLYWKLNWCSWALKPWVQFVGGTSDLGICAVCYIGNWFGVIGFCTSGFDWGGMSDLGICALCYMGNCFGVVGLCSSGFNLWGVHLTWVYVHCAIWETALVLLGSVALGCICRGNSLSHCALHLDRWPNSFSSVHVIWKDDLILVFATRCYYQREHLISVCTSSENMSSFWVWVLHHRGLFYERPTSLVLKALF